MFQLGFPFESKQLSNVKENDSNFFSHEGLCAEFARIDLEKKYAYLLEETHKFSRKTVSFQANKVEALHNWIKYREGFSAELVEVLFFEFQLTPEQMVLDPFAGSCTTLLEAKLNNINAVGIELLPHCHLAWEAKSRAFDYDVEELLKIKELLQHKTPPNTNLLFPHLLITEGAFPLATEKDIVNYKAWFSTMEINENSKILCQALLMSILEDVSFTRKDGQYLRWDERSDKIVQRNSTRVTQGKKTTNAINKGDLPTVQSVLLDKMNIAIRDIVELQKNKTQINSHQELIKGSTLFELPKIESNKFDAVITSPPYANRYDYTRTYALELAFLQVEQEIFRLRQDMLSCTVENRAKNDTLQQYYQSTKTIHHYEKIIDLVNTEPTLQEINVALQKRSERGEINNEGILNMLQQYFMELTFVYSELYRVCKTGARVAFVNDNVRYAGEVIPVDTMSTSLAEKIGFVPLKIYVLPQRKGNSSQQMGKFGRRELRKSITIWQKP